jgi:hypothetical protein
VRFPSKRSALLAYEQQRVHVKGRDDNESRLLTHDGRISQTIQPTGDMGIEPRESSMHEIVVSCELLRGEDSGELSILFGDNLKDNYEEIFLTNTDDFQPLDDFIEPLAEEISTTKTQGQSEITLHTSDVLHLFEFYKIFKFAGSLASTPQSSGREYRTPKR